MWQVCIDIAYMTDTVKYTRHAVHRRFNNNGWSEDHTIQCWPVVGGYLSVRKKNVMLDNSQMQSMRLCRSLFKSFKIIMLRLFFYDKKKNMFNNSLWL